MTPPILPHQLVLVEMFRLVGIAVRLSVTRAEALMLSSDDVAAIRELGATDALLDDLRSQAAAATLDTIFSLDFEHQTVTIETTLR